MKIKANWVAGLWLAGFAACLATSSCDRPNEQQKIAVSAAEKAAADRAAADKAAADKVAADKVAADKVAADKVAADKVATEKVAAEKVAAEKVAADKVAAEKVAAGKTAAAVAAAERSAAEMAATEKAAAEKAAAEKAAAEKSAQDAKTAKASLPADLLQLESEISRAIAQIDVTSAMLDVLTTATGKLDKPSEEALEAIESLDKEAQSLKKRADDMRERGAAYFETWETQLSAMTTPGVVAIATKRKDELAANYAALLTAMQESRSSFDSYWADIQVIREAIDDGLDTETLKILTPQIRMAKDKATILKGRIGAVASKLDQVGVIYTKS